MIQFFIAYYVQDHQMGSLGKDYAGQKIGRLTVLSKSDIKGGWLCQCDCGNTVEVSASKLEGACSYGCGCFEKEVRSEVGRKGGKKNAKPYTAFNQLIAAYQHSALVRNMEFTLTIEQCIEFFQSNCYYCGIEPSTIKESWHETSIYVYNGIDRIDNSIGYIIDNCVTCCKWCNKSKLDRNQGEFIEWIKHAAKYLESQGR